MFTTKTKVTLRVIATTIVYLALTTTNAQATGADLDNDGHVNGRDLHIFAEQWLTTVGTMGKLTASDPDLDDHFGYATAVSGNYAIIGACMDDPNGIIDGGAAYIFQYSGVNWTQKAKLVASDRIDHDHFGKSVDIDSTSGYAIVGAPDNDSNGAAYVFKHDDVNDLWTQVVKLVASDGAPGDDFGESVSIEGLYAVVGAPDNAGKGAAYVYYSLWGAGWGQQTKLTRTGGAAGDRFGQSVSISTGTGSGDTIIVGAENAGGKGSAQVFMRQGIWVNPPLTATVTATDGASGDKFGHSVSLSGNYAIVGAYEDDDGTTINCGSAYVFYRNQGGTNLWGQQAKLTPNDTAAVNNFGRSVCISGDRVVVGAPLNDSAAENAGAAYIFEKGAGWSGTMHESKPRLTADPAASADYFGRAVAVSSDYILIGAYQDDDTAVNSGSVHAYSTTVQASADLTGDSKVNFRDFVILGDEWRTR